VPARVRRQGRVVPWRTTLTNPEVHVGDDAETYAGALMPVYPATAKLPSWRISQCMRVVLDTLGDLDDPVPRAGPPAAPPAGARRGADARPSSGDAGRRGPRARTAALGRGVRAAGPPGATAVGCAGHARGARVARPDGLLTAFDARLPFELTDGQRSVCESLFADLARAHPMHRLLQGEVGSGKTGVRAPRDARRGGRGRPGGAARPDGGPGPAAPPDHHRDAGPPRRGRDARRALRCR
jgi:hypothetical protein